MTQKLQELTLELLEELRKNEGLNPAIQQGLEKLIDHETPEPVSKAATSSGSDLGEFPKMLNLKGQYVERLSTLRHFGVIGEKADFNPEGRIPPTYDTIKNSFTREELELAVSFNQPTLLIIPETSLAFKVKILHACKDTVLKHETYINDEYRPTDIGPDKISGWRAVIVDGLPEMEALEGDKLEDKFTERIRARKNTRKPFEKGMDRHKYCLLMMEAVRAGDPIDKKLFTLLDDDPALSEKSVPAADFDPNNNWIRFNWRYSDDVNVCARFRPSVGGEKLLS